MKKLALILAACFLVLSGCADYVGESRGAQIEVVPVTYSMSLKVKPDQQDKARAKLDGFINEHWQYVSSQGATIVWRTKSGKEVADMYYKQLLSRGVSQDKLSIEQGDAGFGARFDLELKTTVHKSILPICDYPRVGHYSELARGCFSESARWQSMVNPEKMLTVSPPAQTESSVN
ncbi:hypothetical protein MHO82_09170 [Vibrio sp. Of7-15]|uniref:hypothetical protein n=1 Tax=Vibrio sp. Of7-15 TaxID=2724879 RepID=UPI001EF2FE41|nr:hypothetical protein [Vibrio sp. Of7-15]MCG7497035.1 hypothetical protein [Vibrio sp. Of7-15]